MRDVARTELDRIDALRPGQGLLEAFVFGRGDLADGIGGLGLDYGHKLSDTSSVFAQIEAGYRYGDNGGLAYSGLAGWRKRF